MHLVALFCAVRGIDQADQTARGSCRQSSRK
jgi:hypothetical protein